MEANTFNGWKRKGRVVCAGQRGAFINEYGDWMFYRSQTKPRGVGEQITVYRDRQGRFIRKEITFI